MRVVLYSRVSTQAQAEHGHSLDEQRRTLEAACKEKGWQLVEAVQDDFSGSTLHRPGIRRIRELAEARAFDVLAVQKLDRLARDNALGTHFLRWLQTQQITVWFLSQEFADNAAGQFTRGIMWEVSAFERSLIAERTMRGKAEKARQGRTPTHIQAFGYRCITRAESRALPEYAGRDGELVPVPEEAEIIRELFRRVAAGEAVYALTRELNERGIRTRRGNAWNQSCLARLLRSPMYAGELVWGQYRWKLSEELGRSGRLKATRKQKDAADTIRIPCPALVERGLWEQVQDALTVRSRAAGRPSSGFLLRGLVFCGECRGRRGEPLRCYCARRSNASTRPAYGRREYRCGSHGRVELPSCNVFHDAEKLEALVLRAVRPFLDPARLLRAAERQEREAAKQARAETRPAAAIRRDLDRVRTEEGRIADVILAGLPPTTVRERVERLQARRAVLEEELRRASAVPQWDEAAAGRKAAELAEKLRETLSQRNENPALLQRLLRTLLRVTLYRDRPPQVEFVRILGASGGRGGD